MKRCKTCCEELPLDAFQARHNKSRGKTYYSTECKECGKEANRARAKKWHEDNLDRSRAKARKAQEKNKALRDQGLLETASEATCSRCNETKAADQFTKSATTKNGLFPYCKSCASSYRQDNKRDPIYVPTVTEKTCSRCGETKIADEFGRAFHAHDGLQNYCKTCIVEYERERYHGLNGWKRRLSNAMYRGRKRGAEGDCSHEEWEIRIKDYAGCCGICDEPLKEDYDIDHIVPLVKGGSNWPSNLMPAHPKCNGMKNDRSLEEAREIAIEMKKGGH